MLDRFKNLWSKPIVTDETELRVVNFLHITLSLLFFASIIIGPALYVLNSLNTQSSNISIILGPLFYALLILGMRHLFYRGQIQIVNVILTGSLLIFVIFAVSQFGGIRSASMGGFILVIILVSLLLNKRSMVIVYTFVSIVSVYLIYYLEINRYIPPVTSLLPEANSWVIHVVMFVLAATLIQYSTGNTNQALERARRSESQLTQSNQQLQSLNTVLEARVVERTRALELSTLVSRRLSTILNEQELVKEIVNDIQRTFNYYHVHIYLFDKAIQSFVMAGGTGEPGRLMLEAKRTLKLGQGLVGRAGLTNTTILAGNVAQSADWLPNPILPETKAEVAVPIALGTEVLGVLDVQHNVVNGLGQQDVYILESIASQAAIALRNAETYQLAQKKAEQETLLNLIAQQIQSTNDMQTALQVTVRELGRALSAPQTTVKLGLAETVAAPSLPTNGNNGSFS